MTEGGSIAERLAAVRAAITRAARAASRDAERIALIAVSKSQPVEAIRAAYAAGQRDFGENYVQELQQKAEALRDLPDLRWHMIGHLQRNKARHVVREATLIHSVDSVELVKELGKRAADVRLAPERRFYPDEDRIAVLVEVGIAGEAQKAGVAPAELGAVLDAVDAEPALALKGLMCVPPFTPDPAASRPHFDALRALRDRHGGPERLPELSMGMTLDFDHAIAAGATLVRVGTAIFGLRQRRPE